MMVDVGVRCDAHVGEVFPPRCAACEQERAEAEQERAEAEHVSGSR